MDYGNKHEVAADAPTALLLSNSLQKSPVTHAAVTSNLVTSQTHSSSSIVWSRRDVM